MQVIIVCEMISSATIIFMCAASVEHRDIASPTPAARDLMALTNSDAVAEREQRIGQVLRQAPRSPIPAVRIAIRRRGDVPHASQECATLSASAKIVR